MPLRAFGGRAAAGALGLQHGNALTDAAGDIGPIVFPVAFGAVPDMVAVVLDGANNYYVVFRAVNALGFTAHARRITTHSHTAFTTGAKGADGTISVPLTSGAGVALGSYVVINDALPDNKTCTTSADAADVAAGAGITVMWMAVA